VVINPLERDTSNLPNLEHWRKRISGYVGTVAGVPVYETSNIDDNGTAGDFVGGLFHRDALGLGIMQDIRIETQRDALLRGDAIVATAMYGTGKLYEAYGVAMAFDSSIV
jgi:hypothetical protein